MALDVPDGQSAIRFRALRAALIITLLNVRVDGQLVTLEAALADGTVGDLIVSPGPHDWSISNAADTEVLASGTIFCPVCNAAAVSPPPGVTTPFTPDTAMTPIQGIVFVGGIALALLGALLMINALAVRRRRR